MQKCKISFVIPVHNEEKILKKSLEKLVVFCNKKNIEPEILVCENGSGDRTREILKELNLKGLKKIYIKGRGLGLAYKEGIAKSTNDLVYFTGIDFPFGYKNISDCLEYINDNDFVLASKAHPSSVIRTTLKRKISSCIYRFLLRVLLGLKTKDPQGCVLFKKSKISKILEYCDSDSAFFETQLALYSEINGNKLIEIPVRYVDGRKDSKFHISTDGKKMLMQIFKEREKIKKVKNGQIS